MTAGPGRARSTCCCRSRDRGRDPKTQRQGAKKRRSQGGPMSPLAPLAPLATWLLGVGAFRLFPSVPSVPSVVAFLLTRRAGTAKLVRPEAKPMKHVLAVTRIVVTCVLVAFC